MCFPETVSQLGRRIRCDDRRSAWDQPTNYLGDWAAFASVGVHRCFGSWGHVKVGSIVNPDLVSRSPISGHIPLPHLRLSSTLTCAHEEGCDCFRLSGIFRLTSTVLVWWLHSLSVWRFWRWSRKCLTKSQCFAPAMSTEAGCPYDVFGSWRGAYHGTPSRAGSLTVKKNWTGGFCWWIKGFLAHFGP